MTPNIARSFHHPSTDCRDNSLTSGSDEPPGFGGWITEDIVGFLAKIE